MTVTLESSGTLIDIAFTAGSSHNNTITGYSVMFQMSDSSYQTLSGICNSDMTLVQQCNGLSVSTLLTATGRTIGDPILVQVSATNTDGTSANSATNTVQTVLYMSLPPNTVSGLAVSVTSSTAVSVSWTSLITSLSGYSAVTSYTVEYRLTSDTTWNTAGSSASSPLSVTGLTPLSTYVFRIKASNVFGTGPTTLDSNIVSATLYGIPSSPGQPSLTQTSGSTSIVATWTAPSTTNGSPLTAYSVQILNVDGTTYSTLDSKCSEVSAGIISNVTLTCTVLMTDLMTVAGYTSSNAGTYIKIRVDASNTYGSSAYSTTNVNSIQVQIAPTAQVTTASLSKTKNTITAIWTTSPTSQSGYGYAPITYYLYRYKLTSGTWPSDWSSANATTVLATSPLTTTISGLTP